MKLIKLLIIIISLAPSINAADWELVKNRNEISVYVKIDEDSKMTGFQAISNINAPIELLHEILMDIPSYTKWFGKCKSIQILENYSDNHFLVYYIVSVPWPVTDRDLVAEVNFTIDPEKHFETVTVKGISKKEFILKNNKYIRMVYFSGKCTLTRIDKNTTRVIYTVLADIGGNIPIKISNVFLKNQPYNIIKGLKEMCKNKKYRYVTQ